MAGETISEGEVAVYDRQLRLWGANAQARLLKSKVLVWGLDGSNIEVCKNLVLAGVALAVRDHRTADVSAVGFNYFLRQEDLGKNRAECAATRIQEMNPLNTVSAVKDGPEEIGDAKKLAATLKDYNVVVASYAVLGYDIERARILDNACREAGSCCVLTVSCGELAFFFANLNDHTVTEKSSAPNSSGAEEKPFEPEHVQYPSFGEWLEVTTETMQKTKVDSSFQLISLFTSFLRTGGTADDAAKFEEYCKNTAKCTPQVEGISSLQHAYKCFFMEPLMHVASIVGGLLAQEVIKAITKRDPPLVNCICFNANTGAAFVERIPAPETAKKQKVEVAEDILD